MCRRSLDNHTPLKKKYIRCNHLPFMIKELPKTIMHRSKLRNNFLRHSSNEVLETPALLCLFVEKNKKDLLNQS